MGLWTRGTFRLHHKTDVLFNFHCTARLLSKGDKMAGPPCGIVDTWQLTRDDMCTYTHYLLAAVAEAAGRPLSTQMEGG